MLPRNRLLALVAALVVAVSAAPAALAGQRQSGLAQSERSLLQAVNAARAANGLRPLRLDARLEAAARSWSASLRRANAFTHGDFPSRMRAFRIPGLAGENLAWGSGPYTAASAVVAMWLASPGHRANLLNPQYRWIGIGVARGTFQGQSGAAVVTADFAG